MLEGVDYSFARPGGAALAAAGKKFAVRYIPYGGVGKGLTTDEIADLHGAGLAIALVFESTAGRVLYGSPAGMEDAKTSAQALARLGFPLTTPVYFACDFNATTVHQPAIDAYLRGAASIIGAERVGIYGGYNVIQRCAVNGTAQWFWQTYAWSAGKLSAHAHLYQYLNGQVIGGGKVDLCRALRDPYGQWDPHPGGGPQIPVEPVSTFEPKPGLFKVKAGAPIYDAPYDPLAGHAPIARHPRDETLPVLGGKSGWRVVEVNPKTAAWMTALDGTDEPYTPPDCKAQVNAALDHVAGPAAAVQVAIKEARPV